jgi:hypothetical protein
MLPFIHLGYEIYIPIYPVATVVSISLVAYLILREDNKFAIELGFFIVSFILASRVFFGEGYFKVMGMRILSYDRNKYIFLPHSYFSSYKKKRFFVFF